VTANLGGLAARIEAEHGAAVSRVAFGPEHPDGVALIAHLADGREIEILLSTDELLTLLPSQPLTLFAEHALLKFRREAWRDRIDVVAFVGDVLIVRVHPGAAGGEPPTAEFHKPTEPFLARIATGTKSLRDVQGVQ
jgi:hypothetical protein